MVINGEDIANYEGADSLFFKKLDCKNDTLEFIGKNKFKFENLTYKKVAK